MTDKRINQLCVAAIVAAVIAVGCAVRCCIVSTNMRDDVHMPEVTAPADVEQPELQDDIEVDV